MPNTIHLLQYTSNTSITSSPMSQLLSADGLLHACATPPHAALRFHHQHGPNPSPPPTTPAQRADEADGTPDNVRRCLFGRPSRDQIEMYFCKVLGPASSAMTFEQEGDF
ncbi:hypothetical protein TSOC_010471 [Tetrabaena socialis]|uniref:Uncharacterized protein n=1 Tax=Tetrabaena socialis TaxID=47790 RepID=A0A2J7ZT62_9CHLO|nr:hypothetical protein TSOC_010471 [Tetrabaena socialis]|eukprot:PNH03461.1 hypothetical protein TSOC_010471 [Tetrabaena socialis]